MKTIIWCRTTRTISRMTRDSGGLRLIMQAESRSADRERDKEASREFSYLVGPGWNVRLLS